MKPICIIEYKNDHPRFNMDNISSIRYTMDESVGDWDRWGSWGHRDNVLYINPNLFEDEDEDTTSGVLFYNELRRKKMKDYIKLI